MLHLYASDREVEIIQERMAETGVVSLSSYLRKMAIDGYIIHVDMSELQKITRLLNACSNNLNQYVRRANETGSIYAADIDDLNDRLTDINIKFGEVMKGFTKIL